MTAARARLVVVAACLISGAAAANACFPDYQVGPGDGGAEAGPGGDATVADGGTDVATPDGPSGADAPGQADGPADAGPHADAAAASDGWSGFDAPYDSPIPTGMVLIEGGTFHFQVALEAGTVDATATLNYTIAVDPYLVTVGRFSGWIGAGMPLPEAGTSLDPGGPYATTMTWDSADWDTYGKDTSYQSTTKCGAGGTPPALVTYTATNVASHPSYPVNCMTWAQALAFCWWDQNKRLLTDTEWRVIATSEGTRMPYPWGAGAPSSCNQVTANYASPTNCGFPVPVGSAPGGKTQDGVYDIVGSVGEWLWDFAPTNPYSYPAAPTTNYAGPSDGNPNDTRVYIGAAWYSGEPRLAESIQPGPDYGSAIEGFDGNGFRCAQTRP